MTDAIKKGPKAVALTSLIAWFHVLKIHWVIDEGSVHRHINVR